MSGTRPPSADATTYAAAAPRSRENQPTGDCDGAGAGAIGSRGSSQSRLPAPSESPHPAVPVAGATTRGAPLGGALRALGPPVHPPGPAATSTVAAEIRADDERRLEDALARRNLTWANYEAASQLLEAAKRSAIPDLTPFIRNYNDMLRDWEWAIRNLQRERVRFAYQTGTHWSQRAAAR